MTWCVEFLAEAEKDMKKMDHSAQIQVLKGIRKVSPKPPKVFMRTYARGRRRRQEKESTGAG